MSKFIKLTKVLLKNSSSSFKTGYGSKKSLGILLLLLICFLPLMSLITGSLIASYDTLKQLNLQVVLLGSTLASASAAMIIFSFFYVMSIFYFSEDIDILLPLPLKPYEILGAKLVIILIFEYFLEIILILPIFIAFGFKAGSILFYAYSVILFLTLPIIPVIFCALISIFIMSFTNVVKNKDRFKVVSGVIGIALIVLINIFMQNIRGSSKLTDVLKNNSNAMNTATNIFPSSKLAAYSLTNSSPLTASLNLLLFLIISFAVLIIFLIAAQTLYFKGAVGISESSSKGKKLSEAEFNNASKKTSVIRSYTIKELKLLIRTPAYLLNCILFGVIFPPLIIIIILFNRNGIHDLSALPQNGVFLAIASGIIVVISSMNMIASTSISREGKNFYVMNYIPVPYGDQIISKALSSIIVSLISTIIISIIGITLLKVTLIMVVLILIISALGIGTYAFLGTLLDLKFPKLDWDNETRAVKQNFNPVIITFSAVIITVILSIIAAVLQLNMLFTFIILFILYSVMCFSSFKLAVTKGAEILGGESYSAFVLRNKKSNPQSKIKKVYIAIIVLFIALPLSSVFAYESFSKTAITLTSNQCTIKAGLESTTIDTKKITAVYLKDTIPNIQKINGYNGAGVSRGKFSVDGLGDGTVFIEAKNGPYLYIILGKDFVIINNKDTSVTKKLYTELAKYTK